MELPKFLLADNSSLPDEIFVVHTEYPRFILSLSSDEIEWIDDLEGDEEQEELVNEVSVIIEEANAFYDNEMKKYEEEEG